MPWGRMDDTFHDHPKVEPLSLEAVGLWTKCWSKALRHLDTAPRKGFVSDASVRAFAGTRTKRLCAELTRPIEGKQHGMWERVDGGFIIHNIADYLPKQRDPREASESGKKGAAKRWAGKNHSHAEDGSTDGNSHSSGHSKSHSSSDSSGIAPDSPRGRARPDAPVNPSRPDPTTGTTSGGTRPETLPTTHATDHPETTPHNRYRCTTHQHVANPPPCMGCKTARERAEAEDTAADERERERRERHLEQQRANCPDCEGTGKVLNPDKTPTRRTCTHPNARRTA